MRSTRIVGCAFVLLAGLLLSGDLDAGSLEPPGPPAPTMKTLSQVEPRIPISSLPFTIASPGSYYLTGSLTGVASQSGITITSSFVTLDLNGFSLIGVPSSLDGIRAVVAGTRHIEIRNGVIRNWAGSGISATATEMHASDLRLDGNGANGLAVGSGSIVRDTTSTGNSVNGIMIGSNSVVSSSTASNNVSSGFQLATASMATDCIAQQNSTGFGLNAGSRVFHSLARQNQFGIFGGDAATIEECTVELNTADGMRFGNRGLVRGNFARGNTNNGILAVGSSNRIEDNEAAENGVVGIRVDGTNNLVVKNSASDNTTEYSIAGGNKFGAISPDPTTGGPWANFDL